jgi:lactoylglutathione lyase
MITKIATTAVYVEDQQRAKSFWTESVGFEEKAEHPMNPEGDTWLEVGPKDAETVIVLSQKNDAGRRGNETFPCFCL